MLRQLIIMTTLKLNRWNNNYHLHWIHFSRECWGPVSGMGPQESIFRRNIEKGLVSIDNIIGFGQDPRETSDTENNFSDDKNYHKHNMAVVPGTASG